jgi:putative ABC transport system permease protein
MRLLLHNLFRKPLRTSLTIFGVAVALFLFCFLESVLEAFNAGVNMASASRIVIQHKEAIIFPLPASYHALIGQVEGVTRVAGLSWFGGLSQEQQPGGEKREEFFAQFAADVEDYLALYPEIIVPPDQLRELMEDRTGCLIGAKLAERLNKKVGDRIVLRGLIWTKRTGADRTLWEFTVRAIYTSDSPTFDQTMMLFHQKYFDEAREFGKGLYGIYIAGISDPNRYQQIASAIDQRFANSPYETRTMTEKAINLKFVSMVGNLQLLIRSIGSAVVLTMLLVSANTMMMSARERTREMGILKAIGFSDGHIFRLIVAEALTISAIGAAVGIGAGYLLANVLHYNPKPDFFPVFFLPSESILLAGGIAGLTGLLSGIVPAVAGMRLKAVEALRSM